MSGSSGCPAASDAVSLRRRFVLVLAAFAVALATTFGFLTWGIAAEALQSELDRRLVHVPMVLAQSGAIRGDYAMLLRRGDESDSSVYVPYQNRLDSLRTFVEDAFVFNAVDGTTLVTADDTPIGTRLRFLDAYRGEINAAMRDASATTRAFRGADGVQYKYGFVRLGEGPAILAVQIPADYFQPLARLSRVLLLGTLGAVAMAVLVAGLLAGNIVRPLERLSRAALRIQRGHMDRPVKVERGDELGRLSRAMERMRHGILERDEQLRLMLAQVAHEIRNPLGGLELFAAAAAEAEDPVERRRLISRMREEVTGLNRIIDDFLTFARPMSPEHRAVDLRLPVREAVELSAAAFQGDGLCLDLDIAKEPLVVAADADRIKRAVLNLLRNASQAARSRVRLRAGRRGSEVEVTVTDDGPGVPEHRRARVFEPFVTDKEQGAGLGLAIVRKVAESHGGRVEVGDASHEGFGSGAEFRVYLPGLEEPPPDPRSAPASS